MPTQLTAYRASVFHFRTCHDPFGERFEYDFFEDGILVVEHGNVLRVGSYSDVKETLDESAITVDLSGKLILPGFIDTHVHYPQTGIIASFGKQLMDWLQTYTYTCERQFADPFLCERTANHFIGELLRNGTTSALIMGTVHKESAEAMFNAALNYNMRIVTGKVLMDRNTPDGLRDTAETGYLESKALIEKWHGRSRLGYAVTPRFAYTSSEAQLEAAGALMKEHDGVLLHTHLAENKTEINLVR
jgi:guanine deaminase